jgi:ATP-dependent RNA helicase DDX52/ROK1
LTSENTIVPNILVTTPQLFLNVFATHPHLSAIISGVRYVIMDECDKFFEESFSEQVTHLLEILATIVPRPVFGLFSATIQSPVEQLLNSEFLDNPLRIEVGGRNHVLARITQTIEYCTNEYGKLLNLKTMMAESELTPPTLIFVQ